MDNNELILDLIKINSHRLVKSSFVPVLFSFLNDDFPVYALEVVLISHSNNAT